MEPGKESLIARSFDEYQAIIDDIRQSFPNGNLLFRGLASSEWKLETTYERWLDGYSGRLSVQGYFKVALAVKPQIETFTNHHWGGEEDPTQAIYQFKNYEDFDKALPLYSYLVYLRHHGFPSPLLDWSSSEYVAAFFAFSNARMRSEYYDEFATVFVYCERPEKIKSGSSGDPIIRRLGPYVKTHPRHFNQRSEYTLCAVYDSKTSSRDPSWQFVPHESVFEDPQRPKKQDYLWKINIPASERSNFLRKLDAFNLNSYSLYQSEESMLETLAFRIRDKLHLGRR